MYIVISYPQNCQHYCRACRIRKKSSRMLHVPQTAQNVIPDFRRLLNLPALPVLTMRLVPPLSTSHETKPNRLPDSDVSVASVYKTLILCVCVCVCVRTSTLVGNCVSFSNSLWGTFSLWGINHGPH